jgi:signal transduction histidine kinase/DNA-binding response OmpR family regulator
MNRPDERDQRIAALEERLSRLSDASRRINESLDFDRVLQGVLDAARSLTAARYGVMTLTGDSGEVEDFLSSGMTAEETAQLWSLPEGPEIISLLGSLSEPLRVRDLVGHVTSAGIPDFRLPVQAGPVMSLLTAPILQQGELAGSIFVAAKEGHDDFSREDEETLVMFASQAAMVIGNARTYREERRARADLETLIDTSPVGVVVFDAKTGAPVSFNREAERIVDHLREPNQSWEELLEVLTYVRADGQEISLRELSLPELLRTGEVIRVEEIVMQGPGGRSVTALLNATPIRSEASDVESVVVTIQDMTPLEEIEQLRAEFLGMVSHELRAPLTSIRGSVTTLLDASTELDPAEMTQFHRIILDQADQMRHLIGDLLDVARIETGTLPVTPERSEVSTIIDEARNRFVSGGGRHDLQIEIEPDLPNVMADRRRIAQVVGNLLSNAARYSPDDSPIVVSAVRAGVDVAVSVADEGRGIPENLLPHLFRKFSRATNAGDGSGLGGSGLGLAICKGIVEAHGGRIWAESAGRGLGARFTFTVPATPAEVDGGVTHPAAPGSGALRPGPAMPLRVLAVDDDPQTLRYVRDALSQAGYTPIVTGDPNDVPRLMQEERPHVVLLDLVLPGSDGIELMQAILKKTDVPVIFISVYGQDEVVARALDTGAADYIVKPFSPTELAARIRAALRKRVEPQSPEPPGPYTAGDLSIDYAERRVILRGQPVELTATEYAVLYELSVNSRRVLAHNVLLQRVWGPERVGEPWLVRDVVKRLRRKLGDDAHSPTYIFTEPRVGYRMTQGREEPLAESPVAGAPATP